MHLWKKEKKKKEQRKKGKKSTVSDHSEKKKKKKTKRTENNKTTDDIVRSQLTIQEKSRKERCCQWMETNKESHCRGVNVAASPCL